jgi:hypothetical protein
MDALPAGLVQTTNVEARLAAADKPRALRLREGAGSERYAWLVPPSGFWDLADYRYIEIPLVNRGSRDVYLTCWAYVPGGWGAAGTYPVDSDGNVFLEPDETTTVWMDLHRHRPGNEAWAPVIDPSRVARVEIIFRSREPGAVVEVPVVAAVGRGPGERHDLSGRLIVPEVTPGDPAAGRRVRRLPPDCSCATVPYILYLPTDWEPGTRYPFIVEFAGARHFHLDCYSPGKAEQGTLGYGMSRGRGFIWVNVPFLEPGGRSEALGSWGDPDLTARHCLDVVRDVCERYGGDPGAGFVTGFSRGAYACSYIALRNDDIADVWLGFHLNQGHAHGDWLGCATGAAGRTARLKGRAVFLTNAGWAGAANVEDVDAGVGGHTDAALLEERPSTLACRAWLRRVLAERPGTRRVSGRVRGPDGQGVAGVRVESGPTHFAVTEADGGYVLPGLVDGEREVRARLTGWSFAPPRREVRLAGADVDGVDFAATREE